MAATPNVYNEYSLVKTYPPHVRMLQGRHVSLCVCLCITVHAGNRVIDLQG